MDREFGGLALFVAERGFGAVEPAGVSPPAPGLTVEVDGGDFCLDRGDLVLEFGQPRPTGFAGGGRGRVGVVHGQAPALENRRRPDSES